MNYMTKIGACLIASLLVSGSFAQTISTNEVPESVVSGFNTTFKDADSGVWSKERAGHYQANFRSKEKELKAVFKANGLLQRTLEPLPLKKLPVKIEIEAKKLLTEYRPAESWNVTTPDQKVFFLVVMQKDKDRRYLTYDKNYNYMGENYFDDQLPPK